MKICVVLHAKLPPPFISLGVKTAACSVVIEKKCIQLNSFHCWEIIAKSVMFMMHLHKAEGEARPPNELVMTPIPGESEKITPL